jgi:gliding motility-associated-like protein
MKKVLAILVFVCVAIPSLFAEHIKGGEMYYEYLGVGQAANTSRYKITLKIYIDCNANNPGQLDSEIPVTIFDKSNSLNIPGSPFTAPMVSEQFIRFDPASNPCINNPPTDVCYRIRWYSVEVTVPINNEGYIVAYQRCCRIYGIVNLQSPSNSVGATYQCEIPGTNVWPEGYKNSSPRFQTNDATAICRNSEFSLSFAADEPNGTDSLVYSFCGGFLGASQGEPTPPSAATPPYPELNYQSPYNGGSPLGSRVTINSKTGLITGVAPATVGQYVITVCAYEYRQGKLINIHRKDIHVKVSDCIPLSALLKPDYSYCDDFFVTFKNEQLNPTGSVYIWQYGDNSKPDTTTDIQGRVQHQYADTGAYVVRLKVVLAGQCLDSTTTIAKVYPGFYPGFLVNGTCILLPLQFNDTTKSKYGAAAKWRWDFGDETTQADTSHAATPSWKYSTTGFKRVTLIVESNKGCVDTVYHDSVDVRDRPPLTMAFKDTLICSIDTLVLHGIGNGVFSWGPPYNIFNQNTPDPSVYPKTTTRYTATLNENGCISTDTVRVRVVDFVTLTAGRDSTICLTDSIRLRPTGDGLKFLWSSNPASPIDDVNAKNPLVSPVSNVTTYHVIASIGKCNAADDVSIRTIPYPESRAGADTIVCFEDTASLHGSMKGASFTWSPTSTLSAPNSLNTFAYPLRTTGYILTVRDTIGCPKPKRDTVVVTVRDEILAFAGNDTAVVVDQPLMLRGTGAEFFDWEPPLYLNRNNISSPVALLQDNFTYTMKTYTIEGCYDMDTINIKVFKTAPDIFVPNAFVPGSTHNNVLRPIPVGISNLEYFRVYNRWGQLVFQTTQTGKGWDGTLGGKNQDSGTYVWMVRGKDYTGKTVIRRGTAILIR